jgi:putative ABC transport system permease protein
MYDILNAVNNVDEIQNDLASFKTHLEKEMDNSENSLATAINGVQYSYDFDLQIYTKNVDNNIIRSDTQEILSELIMKHMKIDMEAMNSLQQVSPMGSMSTMPTGLWQELLPGNNGEVVNDLITKQFDLIYGSWPDEYNEVVLVLDENNELDDVTLYALGLLPEEDMNALADAALNKTQLEGGDQKWSYEEICSREYRTVLNADCYSYDESQEIYTDLRETDAGLRYLYDNALSLKITGIMKPNETAGTTMINGSICYTNLLTKHLIEKAEQSKVIAAQKENPQKDILTNLPFDTATGNLTNKEKQKAFTEYVNSLKENEKAEVYIAIQSIPSENMVATQVENTLKTMKREDMETALLNAMTAQMSVSQKDLEEYFGSMNDKELTDMFTELLKEQIKMSYAQQVQSQMKNMPPQQLVMALEHALSTYSAEEFGVFYDEIMEFSDSTYENNLKMMGSVDIDSPSTINIYASSFENKDIITDAIETYNNSVDELQQIQYTDYVGLMMSSVTTIINAITYVLIAFVAISLIVSSIMIGVITLISVQERTKEIGILRAIGASKKNVSGMFNAETMIVGFASGLLGVVITYLLCIPINYILHTLTGIQNLSAVLPLPAAIILVVISVLLTLIAGIIPSRSAAKKDPVVALRTE